VNANFPAFESAASIAARPIQSSNSSDRARHSRAPSVVYWLLAVTLLATFCAPAVSQTLESDFTYSGHFTFSDFSGTVHQLHYADLDNLGGNNISMPGYDWQGDGSNQGPDFHVSCSATLIGTKANVNRGTQSDTPPLTFPPANWSDGEEVTIIDFKIDRSGSGGGGDCEAGDFDWPELSIEKRVNDSTSASVTAGSSFTYDLIVSNVGDGALEDINVVDELDLLGSALSVDAVSPGSPTCELSGTTLDCVFANLAEGASETITITMLSEGTTEDFCGSVQNSASATGYEPVLDADVGDSSNVVDVDIVDCQTIEPGQIAIIKNTVGGDGSFDFSGDLGNFTIATSGGSGNDLSTNLSPGSYTVSESVTAGWSLTSISCVSDSGSSTSVSESSATIDLGSGGDVTCTFTNTLLEPGIEITKSDGGQIVSQGSSFAYGLSYSNTGELDLTDVVITETVPDDTTFDAAGSTSGWSCADGAGPGTTCEFNVGNLAIGGNGSVDFGVTVDLLWEPDPETGQCDEQPSNPQVDNTASIVGESDNGQASDNDSDFTPISVSCDDLEAGLTVEKIVSGGDTSQVFAFAGSASDDGFSAFNLSHGQSQTFALPIGTYSVNETVPEGWELESATCTGGNTIENIELADGGSVLCTFTNRELAPGIEITKTDGGQIVSQEASFAYSLGYSNTGELDLTGVVITETVPDDTTFDAAGSTPGWSCADDAGPGTTCEFNVGNLAIGGNGSVDFGVTVDLLWEPDPETGQCDEQPSNPQVDNTASIVGESDNGQASDNDSDFTPISVSCDDLEAVLIVEKLVSVGDTNESFQFSGSSSDDGFNSFSLSHDESRSFALPVGTYSVSETVPEGWELESAVCTGGNTPENIDLGDGESVTCTFTNRELDPGISIHKSANSVSVGQGNDLHFILTYSNNGEVDLTDVVITEIIPENSTFNYSGPNANAWTCDSGVCTHDVGNLPSGGSGEIRFPLTADMVWEPDPETEQCPPRPENPRVNNTAEITGTAPEGEVSDSDSASSAIIAICQDSGGEAQNPPMAIPVNHPLGMALLIMLMALLAGVNLQRRNTL
jgi:uncharacterized repeat protein (TIGR01451 family)